MYVFKIVFAYKGEFCSVLPLLRESIGILMQRTPRSLDLVLPSCYQKVSCGVMSKNDSLRYMYLKIVGRIISKIA